MLQIYWLILFFISILTVFYFNFILFLITGLLVILLAIYLALEVNTRDLIEIDYFKNNILFDLNEEINLISRNDFKRTSYFNCLSSSNSKTSPLQQLFNRKQMNFQQKYTALNDENRSNETYTGDAKIDEQINDLINLVLRDYVYSWYSNLSSNQEFINELKLILQTIIRLLVHRISKIDKINYITTKLVDNFVQHLKLYRMAKQNLKTNNIELTDDNLKESFFNFELQLESNRFCRDAVSENNDFCLNYLTELTSILEYLILPPDIFNNRTIKYFVNSILINSTFYPLLELLSSPDFINQSLISVCKTKKLNISLSESFLVILRSSTTKDELNAVLESVREEIASQQSKDTGDSIFEIKQQLSSLCFVNSIIKERLKQMNENGDSIDSSKLNQEENNNFNEQNTDLYSLHFDYVLSNPLALTYFFEYMITINKQSYLNFYLSVEGFRLSVEQKLVSIQMKESQELMSANDYRQQATDSNMENIKKEDAIDLTTKEIIELNNEMNEHVNNEDEKLIEKLEMEMQLKLKKLKEDNEKAIWLNNLIERARGEARNIYDTYLSSTSAKQHRIVVDDWLVQDLKRKIDNEELSETWFDTIHTQIYRRLREEEIFFSSFKKSIHYYKLLKELGLLKSSRDKQNLINKSNSTTTTSQTASVKATNATFYFENDNDTHSSYDIESLSSLSQDRKSTEMQEINNLLKDETNEFNERSQLVKLDADITSTGITREFGKEFGVYCINVTKQEYLSLNSDTDFKEEKWCVVRRYSDFYTFHQNTIKLFPQLNTKLTLPGKKPFSIISQEFLEQRKHQLNTYLKHLLNISNRIQRSSSEFSIDENRLKDHIIQFFESGNYLPKTTKSNSNNNKQILAKTMNTVLNPFKSMKTKPVNLNIIEGIAKIKPFGSNANPDKQQVKQQQANSNFLTAQKINPSFSSSSLYNLQFNQPDLSPKNQPNLLNQLSNQLSTNSIVDSNGAKNLIESETNIPLRILLLLMDEIFDLKTKSFWLRRRIFGVIKQIIQTTYGNTINRKIISFINRLFSSSYIESYIKTIKKNLWPNGYRAMPSPERDQSTKLRTKVATKMLLLGVLSEDLIMVLGSETSRKSIMGLFNMLQCSVLNRRLVIVILETFLIQLFPENEFEKVFERLHSSGTKHKEKLDTNQSNNWPPYLMRMNLNSNMSSNSEQSSKTSPIYYKS